MGMFHKQLTTSSAPPSIQEIQEKTIYKTKRIPRVISSRSDISLPEPEFCNSGIFVE